MLKIAVQEAWEAQDRLRRYLPGFAQVLQEGAFLVKICTSCAEGKSACVKFSTNVQGPEKLCIPRLAPVSSSASCSSGKGYKNLQLPRLSREEGAEEPSLARGTERRGMSLTAHSCSRDSKKKKEKAS